MKKYFFFVFIFLIFPVLVLAGSSDGKKKAVYFYAENCSHCDEVEVFFRNNHVYDRYEITKIEVSGPYNMDYLNDFFDVLSVKEEKRGWPVIFFGNRVLVGDEPIKENFLSEMEQVDAFETPTPEILKNGLDFQEKVGDMTDQSKAEHSSSAFFWILAALVDALNPCAIALTVIFLIVALALKNNARNFRWELVFLSGIFSSYWLLGLAVYFSWGTFFLARGASFFLGFLAIAIGSLSLGYSFFLRWTQKFFLWLGDRREMSVEKIIQKPGVNWVLGFCFGFVLVPCFRGTYQGTVFLLKNQYSFFETFVSLALYNLVFLFPMIAIVLLKRFFFKKSQWGDYFSSNYHLFRLVFGGIMLFMGVYVIVIWI